jgi:hypothetical protein
MSLSKTAFLLSPPGKRQSEGMRALSQETEIKGQKAVRAVLFRVMEIACKKILARLRNCYRFSLLPRFSAENRPKVEQIAKGSGIAVAVLTLGL